MRGADVLQESMFTVRTLNDYVPPEHPLRPIREILNGALTELDELFARAIPCYMGHALMENRHGLALDTRPTQATGTAEREAALAMLAAQPGAHGKSVGADKAYDHAAFVEGCRELGVTPHVAQNTSGRASRIDERTTRHPGYGLSQCIRKLIEALFADGKQHGVLRQVQLRGRERVDQVFTLAMTVANLRRLPRLIALHASG